MFKERDINFNILLESNINQIKNFCKTYNKQIYNICQDSYFWHLKFEHDNLPLPEIDLDTPSEWIQIYNDIYKKINYYNFIIDNYDNIHFYIHDINVLKLYVDANTYKKLYLNMTLYTKLYVRDIDNGYDDNLPCITTTINNTNVIFEIEGKHIKIVLPKIIINNMIYKFISLYYYPYDSNTREIIAFDIEGLIPI